MDMAHRSTGINRKNAARPTGYALLRALTVVSMLALAGCKTLSPDGGIDFVAGLTSDELRKDVAVIRTAEDAVVIRERVAHLLKRSLTPEAAVQIALLNNRGLQAAYNELGIAEVTMVDASRPPIPTFSIERMTNPAELEIERRIVANILSLATLPARAEIAEGRFRQAQYRAVGETFRVGAEARRAWYRAVAARELAGFLVQAQSAAETATQLTKRLGETGAVSKLDQARDQVFYAEITAQLATARQRATSERERLVRWMGLWGSDLDFKLPAALPPLPRVKSLPAIEIEAIRKRGDLQIARIEVDTLAKSYGLTQATRFISLLEIAGIDKLVIEKETGHRERTRGFEMEFQIPIFDFGAGAVRRGEQTYTQAVNRLIEKAINVRSEARDAYRVYRSTYDIAAHYRREVLPLRKIISDETLLRYNAMQIDVFALLVETRQRINSTVAALEAQREFWLAQTGLMTAVVGGGGGGESESARPAATAEAGGGGH